MVVVFFFDDIAQAMGGCHNVAAVVRDSQCESHHLLGDRLGQSLDQALQTLALEGGDTNDTGIEVVNAVELNV